MDEIVRTSWRLRVAGTTGEESLWWDGCLHDPSYHTRPHGWPTRERAVARHTDYAARHLNTPNHRDLELVEVVMRETQAGHGVLAPNRNARLMAFAASLDTKNLRIFDDAMRARLKRKTVFRFIVEAKDLRADIPLWNNLTNVRDADLIRERMAKSNVDVRRYFIHERLMFCQEMADVLVARCLFEKTRCIEIPEDILYSE